MRAEDAIEDFRKELRLFGAQQFGTDNMRTVQACIDASLALTRVIEEMRADALLVADWPSQRT